MEPKRLTLLEVISTATRPREDIHRHVGQIRQDLLARSHALCEANFTAIHVRDLELLFNAYDDRFFAGSFRRALDGRRLTFRLSSRMTRAGGTTTRFRTRQGEVSYEIAIAISMLFDGFATTDRSVTVCGIECKSRLEALQRIFEHEMVHLAENLCWGTSDCAAPRFQEIAARFFLHRAHTHDLITRRERAAENGVKVGSRVTFLFEGRRLTGRVNRVTKRATVLVEDSEGTLFSDGLRYRPYYVPIQWLEPVEARTAGA